MYYKLYLLFTFIEFKFYLTFFKLELPLTYYKL